MKRFPQGAVLRAVAFGIFTLGAVTPFAQARPRPAARAVHHSVRDYFRLLPSTHFEGGYQDDRKLRLSLLEGATIDLKNDYLRTGGDAAQPALELAVFRYRGTETLAVSGGYELGSSFTLYRLQSGKLHDVTRQLLPVSVRDTQHAVLPRYGTKIRVQSDDMDHDDSGRYLYSLQWRNGRFVKAR